jgi:F0F1-type ATP synthase epsilon subunit
MLLTVTVRTPSEEVFQGKAASVILPGESGVFEVLPFHKRILSRLVTGTISVDERDIPIKRGIVMVDQNTVTVIAED